jgi:translocation and assembly module TamA
MSRPLAVLVLGLALGAAGCVRGRGSPAEPYVDELRFRGVHSVDEDDLAEKLATQGPVRRKGILGFVAKDRRRLDPDALAVDRRRVEAYYRERGHYRARVEDVDVRPAGRGLVEVVFHVSEGPAVRISEVTVKGLEEAPEAARRAGALPVRPGQPFTEAAYDAARARLQEALLATGYATGEVTQSALVLPEAGSAELRYEVRPGPRYRFGPIFVAGSSAVARERIRDQAAGAVETGAFWDESKLARAQARVFALGVFGGVRVTRGTPDATRGTIPVVVAVREAPFRTLRFGPGIGVDPSRWEAHALFGWEHRNFMGDLRRVRTDLRAGYAWVPTPIGAAKAGTVALVGGELQQPGAFTRYVDASARLEVEKGVLEAYDFYAERLRLGLPLRISPRWSIVPSYNLEVYQLSRYALDVALGSPDDTGVALENCRGSVCLLSYLEQRLAWDGRDNPLTTRRGYYVSLAVQEGFHVSSYGYQYLRILPEVRAFYPLGDRTVLALRARVGALIPLDEDGEPPLVARFTAGGPLSMRGYYTQRLAPMVRQRGEWVPVGGNGVADGSIELRFDLNAALGAAVFLDAGSVSDATSSPTEYQKALDPTRLQFAAGAGLRYRTPFGPLRLDVAARLPRRLSGDELFPAVPYVRWSPQDTTFFPHQEPIVAVHLALGEAF